MSKIKEQILSVNNDTDKESKAINSIIQMESLKEKEIHLKGYFLYRE